jgi:hypothetical protein
MKTCVEATAQLKMEPSDPNFGLKHEYELSLNSAAEEISQELGRVTRISSSEEERVDAMVKKAAKLWLEVGQQRCRMFVVMNDSGKEPARSVHASVERDGMLGVVVLPELRRIGNADGERLDQVELVAGCKGKFSTIEIS